MYKLLNKKGVLLGPVEALIASTIVIAIILVISAFFILATSSSMGVVAQEANDAALNQEASQSLKAYLHTPVVVSVDGKNQEMEMIDLIRLANIDSNYVSLLEKETKNIFDQVYPERYGLSVKNTIEIPLNIPEVQRKGVKYQDPANIAIEELSLPGGIKIKFQIFELK